MNDDSVISILTNLNDVSGISGHEEAVGDRIAGYLQDYTDEQFTDGIGNRYFVKKGRKDGLKLMISAHMDEIGFIVHDITDDGYVLFLPVGVHNPQLLANQVMTIHTAGGEVEGVIGCLRPVHQERQASAPLTFGDLKIDVGAENRKQAEMLGIKIGDAITNERGCRVLNHKIFSGKAVDNRSGCTAMILAMQLLQNVRTEATIYCCGTVQEELGVKGAKPAAAMVHPDAALSVDVCFAAENGNPVGNNNRMYLGKGPAIQLYDWSPATSLGNIVLPKMKNALVNAAKEAGIPFQFEVTLNCGTDAAEISLSNTGVLTGGVGIPNRYMHSAVGTVHIDDVKWAGMLIAQFARDFGVSFC